MPMSLRLDADTERLVSRLARTRRQTKSEVVREAIRAWSRQHAAVTEATTVYQAITHLVGCVDSGRRDRSEQTGRRFRALLVERTRARRLG